MPRGEFFWVLLDGMKTAREDGDLLKENLLFCQMLDILRDPNLVKQMTRKQLQYRQVGLAEQFSKGKK